MLARTVADRHLPFDSAGVQIVGRDAAVRRFVERQTVERRQTPDSAASIRHVAARRITLHELIDDRTGQRWHEERAGRRINAGPAPVGAADVAGQLNRATFGGRREQRTAIELLQDLERLRFQLRREVDHIAVLQSLSIECGRSGWKRLRLRRLLTWRGGLRDRPLLNRPDWHAGLAI